MKRREFLQLGLTGVGAAALAGKARALEYYPKPSPKKWAVIYSTWCGSSRDAGVWVSEGMGGIADVFDVKENPDLKTHEHIVLGSSIRGGKINPLMERYIRENRNLMNVAVSRARAVLHIVGNRDVCLTSSVPHLQRLAGSCMPKEGYSPKCGATVFESPWEKALFDALEAEGVETFPQYPLAGRRLDLAVPAQQLDIEVDGERYHRDAGGRRKAEDLWRDLALEGLGWRTLRFWVYELREDMAGCVVRVQEALAR